MISRLRHGTFPEVLSSIRELQTILGQTGESTWTFEIDFNHKIVLNGVRNFIYQYDIFDEELKMIHRLAFGND